MMEFQFTCKIESDMIYFRASGFAVFSKIRHLRDTVISELKKMEGRPFKIMFDLRGLKALDPNSAKALQEIDDYLYECSATKVGTVLDSIVAKVQHMRLVKDSKAKEMLESGRSKIFSDPEECRKWLAS